MYKRLPDIGKNAHETAMLQLEKRRQRVTLTVAARLMGMAVATLRCYLQQGKFKEFGAAAQTGTLGYRDEPRWSYYINHDKFMRYMRITPEQLEMAEIAFLKHTKDKWGSRGCRRKMPERLAKL